MAAGKTSFDDTLLAAVVQRRFRLVSGGLDSWSAGFSGAADDDDDDTDVLTTVQNEIGGDPRGGFRKENHAIMRTYAR